MTRPDFFDRRPEATPERLDLAVDFMRELSRATSADAMVRLFGERVGELIPVTKQLAVTRRGLKPPQFRVTRYSHWSAELSPFDDTKRLPILAGGILSQLLDKGTPTIVADLAVVADDPACEYLAGQRSLVAIPLFDGGEPISTIVFTRDVADGFRPEALPDLVWMTNLYARATRAAHLTQQLKVANDQANHEMRQIAKLQRALLPKELPKVSTLDLAVYSRATATAGGDYYDVMPLPRGRVGMLVADVCGHGASAAMLVAVVHSLVKTYSGPAVPPGLLLSYVNDHLSRMYTRSFGTFVTAIYAVYDPDHAKLTWANAGHPAPRLIRAEAGKREVLKGQRSVPLGIVDNTEYASAEVRLRPGDQILLYTDGVTDAKGPDESAFGTERLDAALGKAAAGARAMIGGILKSLEDFTAGQPIGDDYTLLAMKFVKSRKKAGEISGEFTALEVGPAR